MGFQNILRHKIRGKAEETNLGGGSPEKLKTVTHVSYLDRTPEKR